MCAGGGPRGGGANDSGCARRRGRARVGSRLKKRARVSRARLSTARKTLLNCSQRVDASSAIEIVVARLAQVISRLTEAGFHGRRADMSELADDERRDPRPRGPSHTRAGSPAVGGGARSRSANRRKYQIEHP